jgi:multidrug efflux pump subunit AcrA (membrane-fusion protein)
LNLDKKTVIPAALLLSGAAVFALLQLTRAEQPPAEISERVWRVEVLEASPATRAPSLTLYGEVETPGLLNAAAPGDAIVEMVAAREGDRVESGDILVRLDPRDFEPRVAQARADVQELEAQIQSEGTRHSANLQALKREKEIMALAQAAVERAERLKTKNLGSDSSLDEARQNLARQALTVITRENEVRDHSSRMKQLEARLERARARLSEIELEKARSLVTAPFDGIVSRVAVAAGDRVRRSDVLVQLYAPQDLEVRARIPAPYRGELVDALRRGETIRGAGRLGSAALRLHLDRLSGQADPRGVDGLFAVDEGREWLRLGDMLQFELRRPERENAVALPYQALYGDDRVYLLEDGRMRGIRVEALGSYTTGDGEERLLVRSEAIQDGDRVVTTHLPNAVTGLRAEAVGP